MSINDWNRIRRWLKLTSYESKITKDVKNKIVKNLIKLKVFINRIYVPSKVHLFL